MKCPYVLNIYPPQFPSYTHHPCHMNRITYEQMIWTTLYLTFNDSWIDIYKICQSVFFSSPVSHLNRQPVYEFVTRIILFQKRANNSLFGWETLQLAQEKLPILTKICRNRNVNI